MPTEIAIPFTVDRTGAIATVTDPLGIAGQHLETYIATSPGERRMRPTFGTPVQRFIFDVIDSVGTELLRQRIIDSVSQDVPEASLLDLTIDTTAASDGTLSMQVAYSLPTDNDGNDVLTTTVTIGGTT
jgi:uncharacterized protein